SQATANRVQGNFIGTDRTGKAALGLYDGVDLDGAAVDNLIGGPSALDGRGNLTGLGNLIPGTASAGIFIADPFSGPPLQATPNRIEGNFIGTDVTGTAALP